MALEEMRSLLAGRVNGKEGIEALLRIVAEAAGDTRTAWAYAQGVWEEEAEDDPNAMKVADWCQSLGEEPEATVDKVLQPGSLVLLSAKPKSGKTFLALQLADDVASGRPMFGQWPVLNPGPVVYFSMEDPPHVFRRRCVTRGLEERNPPLYIVKGEHDLSTEAGIAWMCRKTEPLQPKLIVIDTARQALNMDNWNDAAEVTRRLRPLRKVTNRLSNGCSILLVAHNNKSATAEGGDRISGSNALQSNVDAYIIVDKKKKLANGDLQAECQCEGRWDMPADFTWVMDHQTLWVRVLDEEDAERAKTIDAASRVRRYVDRVVAIIDDLGGEASRTQIQERFGLSDGFVSNMVTKAKKAGAIVEVRQLVTQRDDGRAGARIPVYGIAGGWMGSYPIESTGEGIHQPITEGRTDVQADAVDEEFQ